jgi:hypothetical protein
VSKANTNFGSQVKAEGSAATASRSVRGCADEVKAALCEAWLPRIYRARILPLRTRAFHLTLPTRRARIETQHTLLGVELKINHYRIMCPDLATARYLGVWARAGCADVAVPYDITKVSHLADELESAWHRMLLLIEHDARSASASLRSRVRRRLIAEIQREIKEAGAGRAIPEFNQNTKQRRA